MKNLYKFVITLCLVCVGHCYDYDGSSYKDGMTVLGSGRTSRYEIKP